MLVSILLIFMYQHAICLKEMQPIYVCFLYRISQWLITEELTMFLFLFYTKSMTLRRADIRYDRGFCDIYFFFYSKFAQMICPNPRQKNSLFFCVRVFFFSLPSFSMFYIASQMYFFLFFFSSFCFFTFCRKSSQHRQNAPSLQLIHLFFCSVPC